MTDGNGRNITVLVVTTILALTGITTAIYATMSLRISALESHISKLESKIDKVEEDARLVYLLKTDMTVVNRRLDEADAFLKWWYETIPVVSARHDEQIKKLEWYVYGKGEASMFKDSE